MTLKFGCIGDSGVDAYRGDDNRGGSYAAVTFNPAELLVRLRGFDMGAWGTYGEPRRTDYAHNWARSAAETLEMASQGQVTGLAGQIESGLVEYAYIRIGANDFAWYDDLYGDIYSAALTGGALTTELTSRADAISGAAGTLLTAGALGVCTRSFVYWGEAQAIAAGFTSEIGRGRVQDAVLQINDILVADLESLGVAWVDLQAYSDNLFTESHEGHTGMWFGSEFLQMDTTGDEPHNWMLADNVHIGTVASGGEANDMVIRSLNARYNTGIMPLTASELWLAAGVTAGGVFGSIRRQV